MVRALGIDSGTMSMDLLGFDDEGMEVFIDAYVPREEVTRNPRIIVDMILEAAEKVGGLDAVVMSSGYGIPLKRAKEAGEDEIVEATFTNSSDARKRLRIHGLRDLMFLLKRSDLPVWFTPSVIQLESVPGYRKVNRIDMGTSDKVYSVAAALRDEVELEGVSPRDARFILVEAGYAYTAAILVDGGRIVDGVGGTSGWWGFLGSGCLDAEVAYLLASSNMASKRETLFSGGASDVAGTRDLEEVARRLKKGNPGAFKALHVLKESVLKDVASLLPSQPRIRRIYLSGRLFRAEVIGEAIKEALRDFFAELGLKPGIRHVSRLGSKTKEAATGAALIANGLAGGRYSWIVESLELSKSRGSVLGYLTFMNREEARKVIR